MRRKLNDPCAKGWLERGKDGAVRLAIKGALDLSPQVRELARQSEKLSMAIPDVMRKGDFGQAV